MYFDKDVEDAIIEYNNSDVDSTKKILWVGKIRPAFSELVSNLINIYRVYNTGDDVKVVELDTIGFMYQNIHKYEKAKGKAFSFFNTIAKHYIIQKAQAARKYELTYQSLENNSHVYDLSVTLRNDEKEDLIEFIVLLADKLEEWIPKKFKKIEDRRIALDIVYLIKKYADLDIHNKKEVFMFVREMTNSDSKKIAGILSILRKRYERIRKEYYSK